MSKEFNDYLIKNRRKIAKKWYLENYMYKQQLAEDDFRDKFNTNIWKIHEKYFGNDYSTELYKFITENLDDDIQCQNIIFVNESLNYVKGNKTFSEYELIVTFLNNKIEELKQQYTDRNHGIFSHLFIKELDLMKLAVKLFSAAQLQVKLREDLNNKNDSVKPKRMKI